MLKALLKEGFEPIIASDGAAGEWLQQEFPNLEYRELPSYGVKYSKSNTQWPQLMASLPTIAKAAFAEKRLLHYWQQDTKAVGVISDNRLGFYSKNCPSVYLSHQLRPQAGMATPLAAAMHKRYYRKFNAIWLPDHANRSLSVKLSSTKQSIQTIGYLSALKLQKELRETKIVILLSGLEPQRSILEQKLFEQANFLPEGSILVRGINGSCPDRFKKRFKIYDRLGSEDLSRIISQANLVISRSGYSSLMDYLTLGKKALIIPTPGQSEQEYLANTHGAGPYFHAVSQQDLNLEHDVPLTLAKSNPRPNESSLPENLFKIFEG
jgi:UDP-N-acetylglucosamine transferase subunit ALG13